MRIVNFESVISAKETLESLANKMCCQKVFTAPYKKCTYCKEFKDCKVLSCRDCAWVVPRGDEDVCLPWLAHDLLTKIKENGNDLEKETVDLDR